MSDLRDQMEREARRIHAEPDALADVTARSHHHQRRRRVGAGVLALAVAATGTLVAVRTFIPTGGKVRPRPAGETSTVTSTLPIWPSSGGDTEVFLDNLQEQVDGGHQPGYLSPEIVAQTFAIEILEWDLDDVRAIVMGGRPVRVTISNPSLPGPMADVRTILTMERWRDREGGIYVITSTEAEILDLRSPTPGQDVGGAEELTFEGSLEGISQRLLDLYLTFDIEGASSSASRGRGGTITLEPAAEPTASGEFEATVAMPEAPPAPGISVFVRSRELKVAVEAFRLGSAEPTLVAPTLVGELPANYRLIHDSHDSESRLAVLLISAADLLFRPEANNIRIHIEPGTNEVTRIFTPPNLDPEAEELRAKVFDGAEIREVVPSSAHDIRIELGQDFRATHRQELDALAHVDSFMTHRLQGSGAEPFLSADARAIYERSDNGLSLYAYTATGKADFHISEMSWDEGRIKVVVPILRGDGQPVIEILHVGLVSDPGIKGGQGYAVLDARRDDA